MNFVIQPMKSFSAALLAVIFLCAPLPADALSGEKNRADEEAGAVLFRDQGCAHCHGADGAGTKKAPSLIGLRIDKAWPPTKITNQILNGGQKMPPFSDALTDQQIAQLVAYLRAKHRPVAPPAPAPPTAPPGQ